MGSLFYGSTPEPIVIRDIVLGHLQAVTIVKLRRGESFTVSLRRSGAAAGYLSTLWMHAAIPLRFVFDTDADIAFDRATLQDFARAANSASGLYIDLIEPGGHDHLAPPSADRSVA
jgi:hypothetical protein